MKYEDKLPPCAYYTELLKIASIKFKMPLDECRNKFGSFSISEWHNLLNIKS